MPETMFFKSFFLLNLFPYMPKIYPKGYRMDNVFAAKKIEEILQEQINVMKLVYEYQKALSSCVLDRSWDGVEQYVLKTTEASQRFLQLDKQCFLFLEHLQPSSDTVCSFYDYISVLPEDQRKNLEYLYRTLQHEMCISKIENDSLSAYLGHACSLINGMMQAVEHEYKSSFYTRSGIPSSANVSSLVVDAVL